MKTQKFDVGEYLDSEEAIEAYLQAAREEGDPAFLAVAEKDAAAARARLKP